MKTNFLPRNKRPHSRRRAVFAIMAVFVVGAIFFSYLGGAFSRLFVPLWHSNTFLSRTITNAWTSVRNKDALIAENSQLKDALASDDELIVSLRSIASSRDALLAHFGRDTTEGIPAAVLVHPPESPYDILVIDAGENVGVRPGSEVHTPEGTSIGVISDVFATSARVKLYSTASVRTDAVLERNNIPVTLAGRGGGGFEFTLPRDTAVEVGDRVLTPNLASALVGVVGDVEVTPTDSFKTILVESPINESSLRYVIVTR